MTGRRDRGKGGRRRAIAAAILALLIVPGLSTEGARAGGSGLKVLGPLPEPPNVSALAQCVAVQVDPVRRRLYSLCYQQPTAYLTEYDLSGTIPAPLRSVPLIPNAGNGSSSEPRGFSARNMLRPG